MLKIIYLMLSSIVCDGWQIGVNGWMVATFVVGVIKLENEEDIYFSPKWFGRSVNLVSSRYILLWIIRKLDFIFHLFWLPHNATIYIHGCGWNIEFFHWKTFIHSKEWHCWRHFCNSMISFIFRRRFMVEHPLEVLCIFFW